jgi:hypothetical protein
LNFAVLLIAFMHVDTQDKPRQANESDIRWYFYSKSYWIFSQIIVMNMTVADLLTCTIYMLTRSCGLLIINGYFWLVLFFSEQISVHFRIFFAIRIMFPLSVPSFAVVSTCYGPSQKS